MRLNSSLASCVSSGLSFSRCPAYTLIKLPKELSRFFGAILNRFNASCIAFMILNQFRPFLYSNCLRKQTQVELSPALFLCFLASRARTAAFCISRYCSLDRGDRLWDSRLNTEADSDTSFDLFIDSLYFVFLGLERLFRLL